MERVCDFMGLTTDDWKQRACHASLDTLRAASKSIWDVEVYVQQPEHFSGAVGHFEWLLLSVLVAQLSQEKPEDSVQPLSDLKYVGMAAEAAPDDLRTTLRNIWDCQVNSATIWSERVVATALLSKLDRGDGCSFRCPWFMEGAGRGKMLEHRPLQDAAAEVALQPRDNLALMPPIRKDMGDVCSTHTSSNTRATLSQPNGMRNKRQDALISSDVCATNSTMQRLALQSTELSWTASIAKYCSTSMLATPMRPLIKWSTARLQLNAAS